MKMLDMKVYRMSISWSRLLPGGFSGSNVNQKAVDHYNAVFDMLLEVGITPWVTLYHWDLPLVLDETYGGFLNPERLTEDFIYYAYTAFDLFGDRVKNWMVGTSLIL
jgi:beta-glucosidase